MLKTLYGFMQWGEPHSPNVEKTTPDQHWRLHLNLLKNTCYEIFQFHNEQLGNDCFYAAHKLKTYKTYIR